MGHIIKNFEQLVKTKNRKIVLDLIESALTSIEANNVLNNNFFLDGKILNIKSEKINLEDFDKVILLGFGKGSAAISKIIEQRLGNFLNEGYVIDTVGENSSKIHFTEGTHPLPSIVNYNFTKTVIEKCKDLSPKTLVLVVIGGGGSSLFVNPAKISLDNLIKLNQALLKADADIYEMNTIRKHLSLIKGGGLAKILYPSRVVSMIFSDVPGNDLSVIASGPTKKDETTLNDALKTVQKLNLSPELGLNQESFVETPKDEKYFENVSNVLVLSNLTALEAMKKRAADLGFEAEIYSDRFQSEARDAAKALIPKAYIGKVLLAGGETTVRVLGNGIGGRNQEVVLGSLPYLDDKTIIASFDSDGWDNSPICGAIGDYETVKTAERLTLDPLPYLNSNNSSEFFRKTEDAIITGRLSSNVSDLIIVLKSND